MPGPGAVLFRRPGASGLAGGCVAVVVPNGHGTFARRIGAAWHAAAETVLAWPNRPVTLTGECELSPRLPPQDRQPVLPLTGIPPISARRDGWPSGLRLRS